MRNNQWGTTTLELLIAVAIGGIVTSAAMALYVTEHKQLLVQDSISDMQSSLRAASAELASKIRLAGYKVPNPSLAIIASNTNPDTITIAYDGGLQCSPITVNHQVPQSSTSLQVTGDISCINDGDVLYVYDPTTIFGENFVCTDVQTAGGYLYHSATTLHESYPVGSLILGIHRYKYYIDGSNASHPNLMIQTDVGTPQVYAENVTNLNLTYILSSGTVVDIPTTISMVREVVIRVDARSDSPDNEFQNQYRTRSLITRVKVRNLGIN